MTHYTRSGSFLESTSGGNGGQISFRDWVGVGADEYGYVAPDPLDPNVVYGGRLVRFDNRTGQSQNVAPEALRSGKYRILRTMPLLFHPLEPKTLLFATNVLWKTTSGGQDWEVISPGLTRERPELPESIGDFRTPEMENMDRRGVIYAVSASPVDAGTIWAGTDDGLVHVNRDGGKIWKDVTPPELRAWDKVSQVDAGHFDADTAYVAVNAIRRDDMRPHVYKTHDGGESWTRVVEGLHEMGPVNVVREDPKQPGLLSAGTERSVYFSIDDGGTWQPLRLNLPPSSMRDLVIHDDDLVVGTHGRSIWIFDNVAPLRELAQAASATKPYLFAPPLATRVRWNMFSDTPLPPEEPAGQNPPDRTILDYLLPKKHSRWPSRSSARTATSSAATRRTTRRSPSIRTPCPIRPTGSVRRGLLARRPGIIVSSGTCGIRRRAGPAVSSRSPPSSTARRADPTVLSWRPVRTRCV